MPIATPTTHHVVFQLLILSDSNNECVKGRNIFLIQVLSPKYRDYDSGITLI